MPNNALDVEELVDECGGIVGVKYFIKVLDDIVHALVEEKYKAKDCESQ